MKIKTEFDLIYENKKKLFNIYTFSESTLSAFKLNNDEISYLNILAKTYNNERSPKFGKLIINNLDKVLVIKMPDYPLPGFVTSKNIPVVNLTPINATLLSDYNSSDIFASYAYTIILHNFIVNKPFTERLEDQVSLFFDSCFMGMFGKKSGLIGSFRSLIPKLKFINSLYVHNGMFGFDISDEFMKKSASKYFLDYKELKLDYDFSSIKDYLHCINDNNIISISENMFSTSVINYGGISSLPMSVAVSRLFSTALMILVKGNHLFNSYWYKKTKNIYEKLVGLGLNYLK